MRFSPRCLSRRSHSRWPPMRPLPARLKSRQSEDAPRRQFARKVLDAIEMPSGKAAADDGADRGAGDDVGFDAGVFSAFSTPMCAHPRAAPPPNAKPIFKPAIAVLRRSLVRRGPPCRIGCEVWQLSANRIKNPTVTLLKGRYRFVTHGFRFRSKDFANGNLASPFRSASAGSAAFSSATAPAAVPPAFNRR